MLALALAVSIAGMFVGPLLAPLAARSPRGMHVLDAITLALVPGVVITRTLPHLLEDGGVAPVLGLVGGYAAYQAIESYTHSRASRMGVIVAVTALGLHALFDGATLGVILRGQPFDAELVPLIVALLLHRVPEGLFVGTSLRLTDRRTLFAIAAGLCTMTVAGAMIGDAVVEVLPHETTHTVIAVGLGVMIRMVVDRHDRPVDVEHRTHLACGLAFLFCIALLLVVPNTEDIFATARAHELSVREALVPLFFETAPLLLTTLVIGEVVARRLRLSDPAHHADAWTSTSVLAAALISPWSGLLRMVATPAFAAAFGRTGQWWIPRARSVLPTYVVGVMVAAVLEAALPAQLFAGWSPVVLTIGAVIVASTVHVGGAAAVVAAVLVHKGIGVPVALAFLLASAARELAHDLRQRVFGAVTAALAAAGFAQFFGPVAHPQLHEAAAHPHAIHEWICAVALVAWIAVDLAAAGPRRWLDDR